MPLLRALLLLLRALLWLLLRALLRALLGLLLLATGLSVRLGPLVTLPFLRVARRRASEERAQEQCRADDTNSSHGAHLVCQPDLSEPLIRILPQAPGTRGERSDYLINGLWAAGRHPATPRA